MSDDKDNYEWTDDQWEARIGHYMDLLIKVGENNTESMKDNICIGIAMARVGLTTVRALSGDEAFNAIILDIVKTTGDAQESWEGFRDEFLNES